MPWRDDAAVDLGTFGGGTGIAHGLNDAGVVVGASTPEAAVEYGGVGTHAVKWENGNLFDPGTFDGTNVSVENDINDDGWITGYGVKDGQFRGFILKPR